MSETTEGRHTQTNPSRTIALFLLSVFAQMFITINNHKQDNWIHKQDVENSRIHT